MSATKLLDINELIENQKLGPFQIGLAALLLLCMFVDGFEAQAPSFVAPALVADLHLRRDFLEKSATGKFQITDIDGNWLDITDD